VTLPCGRALDIYLSILSIHLYNINKYIILCKTGDIFESLIGIYQKLHLSSVNAISNSMKCFKFITLSNVQFLYQITYHMYRLYLVDGGVFTWKVGTGLREIDTGIQIIVYDTFNASSAFSFSIYYCGCSEVSFCSFNESTDNPSGNHAPFSTSLLCVCFHILFIRIGKIFECKRTGISLSVQIKRYCIQKRHKLNYYLTCFYSDTVVKALCICPDYTNGSYCEGINDVCPNYNCYNDVCNVMVYKTKPSWPCGPCPKGREHSMPGYYQTCTGNVEKNLEMRLIFEY
jgi:hypothetical protein